MESVKFKRYWASDAGFGLMAGEIREQIPSKMQSGLTRKMEEGQKQPCDNGGRALHRKETSMHGRDCSIRARSNPQIFPRFRALLQ